MIEAGVQSFNGSLFNFFVSLLKKTFSITSSEIDSVTIGSGKIQEWAENVKSLSSQSNVSAIDLSLDV